MQNSIETISLVKLLIAFVPALLVLGIMVKWSLQAGNAAYALARMLAQLLIIGYFLAYIFESNQAWVIVGILALMVMVSSWIALRTIKADRVSLFRYALIAILSGGGFTLAIMTGAVLELDPWFFPQYMIPLAGMVFSNAMNSVSLAAERFFSERSRDADYVEARNAAFQASVIPITNSLFAVGLVSIPGMMTGQILSGVSPLIAARYQIMVMCMVFASAGISSAVFLWCLRKKN